MADTKTPASSEPTSVLSLFVRLFWMILGIVALGISVMMILRNRDGLFSVADAIYLVTFPLMIGARYLDIARYQGATAYGEPATMGHWRRYALSVAMGAVVVWLAAHGMAYVLAR